MEIFRKIYFIGIGGVSMSALAEYCINCGICVFGSDKQKSEYTVKLKKLGAKITYTNNLADLFQCDCVVYTSAIASDNIEFNFAKNNNIKIFKRSEFLSLIMNDFKTKICVSGSHGKTTVTALLTKVLECANKSPTSFIGGSDKVFSNFTMGKSDICIAEACEYKKNFLDLAPTLAVVLNIDNDHLDSYCGMIDIQRTFSKFIEGRLGVINADDENSKFLYAYTAVTFGIKNNADFTAKNIRFNGKGYSFTLYSNTVKRGRVNLKIYGKHNIYNALAVFAVAEILKVDFESIKKGLESFEGVKRRAEFIGKVNKCDIYADYAHHPAEIFATLKAFNEKKGDMLTVFQPHTYSRTQNLFDDFVFVLSKLNMPIIYKTFPARETYNYAGSAYKLYLAVKKSNKNCLYVKNAKELKNLICSTDFNRTILVGAGDIYYIGKKIIKNKNPTVK